MVDSLSSISDSGTIAIGAGQTYSWSGPAVVTTRVYMRITTGQGAGGVQYADSATFSVPRRSFPDIALVSPPTLVKAVHGAMTTPPHPVLLADQKLHTIYRKFKPVLPKLGDDTLNAHLQSVAVGPDSGVVFTAVPFTVPDIDTVFVHPAIYGPPLAAGPNLVWYNDQNGIGSGTCQQSKLPIFVAEAERHEGVTRAANSHWAGYNSALASYHLKDSLEMLVMPHNDSTRARIRLWDLWYNWSQYSKAQADLFDTVDGQNIFNVVLGCQFDHNPSPIDG